MINILSVIIALSSGGVISAGVYSFITSIGVFPRIIASTHSATHSVLYENCIIAGGILGNIFYLCGVKTNLSYVSAIICAICIGIFVGALAMSLAETINSMAVLFHKIKMRSGISVIVYAIVFGKLIGSVAYFFT